MKLNHITRKAFALSCIALTAALGATASAQNAAPEIKRPDGKPADMTKPVQVFILLGQSNMVGLGNIATLEAAVKTKSKYPYLVDEGGAWTQRKDVRNVFVMCSGNSPAKEQHNDWMSVSNRKSVGPEHGIGHCLGNAIESPVMILKSCIGNRSLGWDLLAPGSKSYEFEEKDQKTGTTKTFVYAGYKQSPMKWEKGAEPKAIGWYAGMQYDGDIANAKTVLAELNKSYPDATKYEVAGFFFWQGDKDRYDSGLASNYEKNLVYFIEQLRKDFNAPNAKFVCATLGQTQKGDASNDGMIFDAQMAVDGQKGKYKQFKGNVATVYTHPLSLGGASNGHYNGNAETYMNVGEAMGQAMVKLLQTGK